MEHFPHEVRKQGEKDIPYRCALLVTGPYSTRPPTPIPTPLHPSVAWLWPRQLLKLLTHKAIEHRGKDPVGKTCLHQTLLEMRMGLSLGSVLHPPGIAAPSGSGISKNLVRAEQHQDSFDQQSSVWQNWFPYSRRSWKNWRSYKELEKQKVAEKWKQPEHPWLDLSHFYNKDEGFCPGTMTLS